MQQRKNVCAFRAERTNPEIIARQALFCAARLRAEGSEGREIRTPDLLIWSQTRYRCAIPPYDIRTTSNVELQKPNATWVLRAHTGHKDDSFAARGGMPSNEAAPRMEPGPSRTRSENHNTRPSSQMHLRLHKNQNGTHTGTHIYTYIHIYIYICIYLLIRMHVYIYIYIYIYMRVCVCVAHIDACMCVCV